MKARIYCQDVYKNIGLMNFSNILITSCHNVGYNLNINVNFINLSTNKEPIVINSPVLYILKVESSKRNVDNMISDIDLFLSKYPNFYNIFIIGCLTQDYFNMIKQHIINKYGIRGFTYYNTISYNSNFADILAIDSINDSVNMIYNNQPNERYLY